MAPGSTDGTAGRAGSLPNNLRESLRISWQAAPGLFTWSIAVPFLQALLLLVQLLFVRNLAGVVVRSSADKDVDVVRVVLPPGAVVLACLLGVLVLDNVQTIVRELLTERVRQTCARRMHEAISRLDLIDFERPEVHDLVLRASSTDFRPAQMVRGMSALLGTLLRLVVLTMAVVVIVPLLVPILLVLAVPVLLVARGQAVDRHDFATRLTPLERRRLYFNRLLTARDGAPENRAYALTDHFTDRYDELSAERENELRLMLSRQWRRMLQGQLVFVVVVLGAAAGVGWLFSSGRAEGTALAAAAVGIVQIAALVGALGFPAGEVAEAGFFLGDQREFMNRIEADRRPERTGMEVPPLQTLELREVSFTYPAGDRPAVERVSFLVRRGEIIALVGPNGSGKTTVAKILGGLYTPDEGAVLWNGVDAVTLGPEVHRARVASVMQDYQTYSETVADSVAFGRVSEPRDDDRVATALAVVGFPPGQLDPGQLIGPENEGGTALSGGQQQRLAIARGIYRSADLLVLDEPTSSLDARAESGLLAELRTFGCTTVLVSHRLANVAQADRIVVFGEGRVVEEGNHDELMAAEGLYHELFTLQASLYARGESEVSVSFTDVSDHVVERA